MFFHVFLSSFTPVVDDALLFLLLFSPSVCALGVGVGGGAVTGANLADMLSGVSLNDETTEGQRKKTTQTKAING